MSNSIETLNGEIIQFHNPCNRAFLYGDGVFTTLKLEKGNLRDKKLHWERLKSDAKKLYIESPTFKFFDECLSKTMTNWSLEDAVIRITLYRKGGRGYKPIKDENGELHISIHQYSKQTPKCLKIQTVKTRLSRNETLAGIKHINRLEQVLIASEISSNVQEAVVQDTEGFVIEGLMSNIIWFGEGVYNTPKLSLSGVDGVSRKKIIVGLKHLNTELKIDFFKLDKLMKAEHIWLCNSVKGVIEVSHVDEFEFAINNEKTHLLNKLFSKQYV